MNRPGHHFAGRRPSSLGRRLDNAVVHPVEGRTVVESLAGEFLEPFDHLGAMFEIQFDSYRPVGSFVLHLDHRDFSIRDRRHTVLTAAFEELLAEGEVPHPPASKTPNTKTIEIQSFLSSLFFLKVVGVEPYRDRAAVNKFDVHHSLKPSGLDTNARALEAIHEVLVQAIRFVRSRRANI